MTHSSAHHGSGRYRGRVCGKAPACHPPLRVPGPSARDRHHCISLSWLHQAREGHGPPPSSSHHRVHGTRLLHCTAPNNDGAAHALASSSYWSSPVRQYALCLDTHFLVRPEDCLPLRLCGVQASDAQLPSQRLCTASLLARDTDFEALVWPASFPGSLLPTTLRPDLGLRLLARGQATIDPDSLQQLKQHRPIRAALYRVAQGYAWMRH